MRKEKKNTALHLVFLLPSLFLLSVAAKWLIPPSSPLRFWTREHVETSVLPVSTPQKSPIFNITALFPGPIFSCGAHSYTVGVLNLGHFVRLLADASNLWWIVQTHIFAGRPTISLGRVCAPCTEAVFSPQQPRLPIRPVALCRTSSSTFSSCSLSVFGCTVEIKTWWRGGGGTLTQFLFESESRWSVLLSQLDV